jgi:hypothetical protein
VGPASSVLLAALGALTHGRAFLDANPGWGVVEIVLELLSLIVVDGAGTTYRVPFTLDGGGRARFGTKTKTDPIFADLEPIQAAAARRYTQLRGRVGVPPGPPVVRPRHRELALTPARRRRSRRWRRCRRWPLPRRVRPTTSSRICGRWTPGRSLPKNGRA